MLPKVKLNIQQMVEVNKIIGYVSENDAIEELAFAYVHALTALKLAASAHGRTVIQAIDDCPQEKWEIMLDELMERKN